MNHLRFRMLYAFDNSTRDFVTIQTKSWALQKDPTDYPPDVITRAIARWNRARVVEFPQQPCCGGWIFKATIALECRGAIQDRELLVAFEVEDELILWWKTSCWHADQASMSEDQA